MRKTLHRTCLPIAAGLSLVFLATGQSNGQQPTVNPGIIDQRIVEDTRPTGLIVDINPYFTEGSTRSDVIQGRIQRKGIREDRGSRRNIFQRFFDRFQ